MNHVKALASAWRAFRKQYRTRLTKLRNDAAKAQECDALRTIKNLGTGEDVPVRGPQQDSGA